MPISLSAKKSLRKSRRNRKKNLSFRKNLRSILKEFAIKPSQEGLKKVCSGLDKAVKNQTYHRNKIARLKSRCAKKVVKKSEVEAEKGKKKK